jgi:hypothetical protein
VPKGNSEHRDKQGRVERVAERELGRAPPAEAADRLVEGAEADRLQRERGGEARAKREQAQAPQPGEQQRTAGTAEGGLVGQLIGKAQERLEGLPAPLGAAVRLAERGAVLALLPVRFGLRMARELLRTPAALVRVLSRARSA